MKPVKMKSFLIRLFIIAILFVFLTPIVAISAQESRAALVIGNGTYKSSPLANPVNDANDMADALKKLGFSVMLKINADQRAMEDSIRAFGKKLRSGGVGLFYYAGHGLQVEGRNYLVPIGTDIQSEADVKYEAVDAGRVLAQMEDAENSMNIIILDACRDNPYARSFRSSERGLAKMDAPTGSILAYATAPGSVAADGVGRNGIYTSKLLKHMFTPGLEIGRLFRQVRVEVMKDSGTRQVPWESSSLTGDFFFYKKRGLAVVERPLTEPQKSIVETTKYASISSKVTEPKIIERDGNFVKLDSGIVYDKNTGFEWYAGPDKDTNWYDAKSWVENLNVAGGGWRMPSMEELRSLYKKGTGDHNISRLFKNSGRIIWSGETKEPKTAWLYNYFKGAKGWSNRSFKYLHHSPRGFAVRSRK
jgi:hypothetical protein